MAENNNQVSDLRNPASNLRSPSSDLCSLSGSAPRLEKPVRITQQVWPEGTVPVVSVFCITYNHVNFIRDAIEGFLMQETTFPVEIFIHDDASTDGTAEIVKEYAEKYPKLFWTILQTENQWSKGNKKILNDYLQKQRGEFIALCEGDDYWISKEKLQKQVEILHQDSSVGLVFHNSWVKHEESRRDYFMNCGINKKRFVLEDIIEREWFIGTASIVYRRNSPLPTEITEYSIVGDMLIQMNACKECAAVYLDQVCSVYRRHANGVSEELWQIGDFHYEKFRPNNIWMYWLLSERVLPQSSKEAIERRIRKLIDGILTYAIMHKRISRSRDCLNNYLMEILLKNKPAFLSDNYIQAGTPLWGIIETQFRRFWKAHRKRQARNTLQRFISPIRALFPKFE